MLLSDACFFRRQHSKGDMTVRALRLLLASGCIVCGVASAQDVPRLAEDGTSDSPPLDIPFSSLASEGSHRSFVGHHALEKARPKSPPGSDVATLRRMLDEH